MTGGGFGGSIVALVESGRAEAFATRVAQAVPGARGFVTRAAAGAREL
jgi:galactokinase